MKAVVYTEHGSADMLQVRKDFQVPVRRKGMLLVRVVATSVNPVDWKLRSLPLPFFPNPKVVGCDVFGVVEECDKDSSYKVGDRVFFMLPIVEQQGGCSELVTIKESHAFYAPEKLSPEEAASLPLVGQTVLQGFERAGILDGSAHGKSILIHAGAGGVGSVAIQIAKHYGLEVFSTCSPRNFDYLKSLGCDRPIDYHTENFEEVKTDYDYIFDLMGGNYELRGMKCIKANGVYINVMNSGFASMFGSDKDVPDGVTGVESRIGSVLGYMYAAFRMMAQIIGPYYVFVIVQPKSNTLRLLKDLLDEGAIKPQIDSVFTLETTADAHRRLETGHVRGKVVIKVAQDAKI